MQTWIGIVLATYSLLYLAQPATCTQCWVCYQARNSWECRIRGFPTQCRPGEICESEIRYSGIQVFLTKRCKQAQACMNDQYQNTQMSNGKAQCGAGRKNSVCRYCCNSNDCNKRGISSSANQKQPKCRYLHVPNGYAHCYGTTDRVSLGTRCRFSCRPGYKADGPNVASCQRRGTLADWSIKVPTCRRAPTCSRLMSHGLLNGIVRCHGISKVATVGTSCVYRCKPRYSMVSEGVRKSTANYERTVCTMLKDVPTWSKRPPTCIAQMCPVIRNLDHGFARCSATNKLGSVCTISCLAGYDLVGAEKITCVQKAGFKDWDANIPVCRPRPCPSRTFTNPLLTVECSHSNRFGSICSMTCRQGYYAVELARNSRSKTYTSTCGLRGDQVDWDLPAPTCKAKQCPRIRLPEGVNVQCTNGEQYMSECTFTCPAPERVLVGQPVLTCTDDGDQSKADGTWSDTLPRCDFKQCQPLDVVATNIDCTEGFAFGSACTFSCKAGFHMLANDGLNVLESEGSTTTMCIVRNDGVAWSNAPPRCEKQRCSRISATDGLDVFCTEDEEIDSACSFLCYDGFEMVGRQITMCTGGPPNQILGSWTNPPPVCQRQSCDSIIHNAMSTNLSCTSDFKFESVCTMKCNEGYYMEDSESSIIDSLKMTCLHFAGRLVWSDLELICRPKLCVGMSNIVNGQTTCSSELNIRAACRFTCDRGFNLIGSDTATCLDTTRLSNVGQWSSAAPTCEPKRCPGITVDDTTSTISCDNSNNFGSSCLITCKTSHFIRDTQTNTNIFSTITSCDMDQNGDMHWTATPGNCQPVACPSPTDPVMTSSCSNGNQTGSACIFSCPTGYVRRGGRTSRCRAIGRNNARWTVPLPRCAARTCRPPTTDDDLVGNCTKGNDYNSTCTFTCKKNQGLYMTLGALSRVPVASGKAEMTCTMVARGRMTWRGDFPNCRVQFCPFRRTVPPLRNSCTSGRQYGSRCVYTCNVGFTLLGPSEATCEEGPQSSSRGVWSAGLPRCQRQRG